MLNCLQISKPFSVSVDRMMVSGAPLHNIISRYFMYLDIRTRRRSCIWLSCSSRVTNLASVITWGSIEVKSMISPKSCSCMLRNDFNLSTKSFHSSGLVPSKPFGNGRLRMFAMIGFAIVAAEVQVPKQLALQCTLQVRSPEVSCTPCPRICSSEYRWYPNSMAKYPRYPTKQLVLPKYRRYPSCSMSKWSEYFTYSVEAKLRYHVGSAQAGGWA